MAELKASPSKLSRVMSGLQRGAGRAFNEGFVHDMLNLNNLLRGVPEVPSRYDRPQSVMRDEIPEAPESIGRSLGRYLSDPENLANLILDPSNLVGLESFRALKPAAKLLASPTGALAAGSAYAADADAGPLSRIARHLSADSEPIKKGIANIIKDRGGNWLPGNLNRSLKSLKSNRATYGMNTPEELAAAMDTPLEEAIRFFAEPPAINQVALNNWIDGPLQKYIKRDLGSPTDPIRRLAETHPIHTSAVERDVPGTESSLVRMGKSNRAQQWEDMVDSELYPLTASNVKSQNLDRYPWVAKLPDDENIWSLSSNSMNSLGFDHMVDEIANGLVSGEISPESLKNGSFSVEAAARYVGEKTEAARRAAAKVEQETLHKNLMNTPYKEYENGYRWVELGDTSDLEAMKACKAIGNQGGWCTQHDWAAEDYGSKGSKLYALLDPNGKPHAQIQVARNKPLSDFENEFEELLDNLGEGTYDQFTQIAESDGDVAAIRFLSQHEDPVIQDGARDILRKMSADKPSILQIKPLENDWSSKRVSDLTKKDPEYRKKITPMLRDFVQSGDWGSVSDLDNVGMVRHNGRYVDPGIDKIYQLTPEEGGSFPSEISDMFMKPNEARELGFDTSKSHSARDLYEFAQQNREALRERLVRDVESFYAENPQYAKDKGRDLQDITDRLLNLDQDFDSWWGTRP